jgi:hypothetical protein
MDAAVTIRNSMEAVATLRETATADPALGAALAAVKRLQAERFRRCYADLMSSKEFGPASRFFLEELYGDADYAKRDQQFARIAGTLATVFPASVVATAVSLSQLHLLTEELDHSMAAYAVQHGAPPSDFDTASYVAAWHFVGRRTDRHQQLSSVLALGHELADLTRKPGVALLLKLMRRPASSAGLGSLQHFLERGFGIFADLSRSKGKVSEFLSTVEGRESAWLNGMFSNAADKEALALSKFRNSSANTVLAQT